jgi:hypothetical protein
VLNNHSNDFKSHTTLKLFPPDTAICAFCWKVDGVCEVAV